MYIGLRQLWNGLKSVRSDAYSAPVAYYGTTGSAILFSLGSSLIDTCASKRRRSETWLRPGSRRRLVVLEALAVFVLVGAWRT